jgi:hypothetical protein
MSPSDDLYTPSQEDIHDQQELLQVHRRRLHYLLLMREQHEAKDVPPWIHTEIEDVRQRISEEKETLRHWQVQVTDHPNDMESDLVGSPLTNSHYIEPEVRRLRTESYIELWKLLVALARYDLPQPVDVEVVKKLSVSMRNWYFEKGGLFLSENSRGPYFELKDVLRKVMRDPQHQMNEPLSNEEVGEIIAVASKLRANLSRDLGTR